MNIPINDKLLGYCSCCILGEAGALKELIKYSSSLYQTDSELRKKVKRLLRKLALAKYPLEGADRYSDEYYMILADYHLGVFGKQKYMSYDRAMAFLSVVQDRESNYSEIAKAKLCCCRVLSSSAEFPPSENDLKKLDENAPRYEFCALTALVFSLSPELPDKTQRKTYQKKALTYLSMLINCNLKCFIDLLNYIGERELLGDVNRKQKKTIRKFSGDSLSDTNWYGLKD